MNKITIWKCRECNAILRERLAERYCENFPQGSSFVCGGILEKWVEGFEKEEPLCNNSESIGKFKK